MQEAAINNAIGEAQTIQRRSEATAQGIRAIAEAITDRGGSDAVSMTVAQQYVEAFGNIAQKGNTIVVPADAGNVASMVSQATAIFQDMTDRKDGINRGGGGTGTGGRAHVTASSAPPTRESTRQDSQASDAHPLSDAKLPYAAQDDASGGRAREQVPGRTWQAASAASKQRSDGGMSGTIKPAPLFSLQAGS